MDLDGYCKDKNCALAAVHAAHLTPAVVRDTKFFQGDRDARAEPRAVRPGDTVPCGRCDAKGYTWSSEGGHRVCSECKGTRTGVVK
jgi:hypothetical protein